MKIINQIILACVASAVIPAHANVTEFFKATLGDHKHNMAVTKVEIDYWKQCVDLAGFEQATKVKTFLDIDKVVHTRIDAHKDYVRTAKRKNPLLTLTLSKLQDQKLGDLILKRRMLVKSINSSKDEQRLIKELFLPNAVRLYKDYEIVLKDFDIHWLKEMKQLRKLNIPELHVTGFDELYTKRCPDLKALRQGYVLNTREPKDQLELLETNRGIDPQSQIKVSYGDTEQDMSIARYEQMKPGAADMYIMPQL